MTKPQPAVEVFAGIDVSAREISVARMQDREGNPTLAAFANNASGKKTLFGLLLQRTERVRVCLEASSNYSLDLTLVLHAHRQVGVSVINPRRARKFAESLGERSKSDPADARVLCQYAARMPWDLGSPRVQLLRLRAITRAIESLGAMHTQESNRAHALASSQALTLLVLRERQRHQHYLENRMRQLRREGCRLIARDADLEGRYRLMLTVPGIGETNALQILGELVVLSDTADARQWVAFSGLDPSILTCGSSVEKRPRISRGSSRHLRHALYMPALVALHREPHVRRFYERSPSHGKARLHAVVAVMRKRNQTDTQSSPSQSRADYGNHDDVAAREVLPILR